jgi:hypothetical protein
VADALARGGGQQERVAAAAGVFGQAVAPADDVHAVAGEAAEIADALGERARASIRVRPRGEEQRVAAVRHVAS